MALEARRFHGKPLLQPNYSFRDVPWCTKDLAGSTISIVTERQHFVDAIAEITLLCNEAVRRRKLDSSALTLSNANNNAIHPPPVTIKTTKPLSIEYIFDRIDTDDPLWGLMIRTDTPMSFKGRTSNIKSSPNWKRGMLQGFITMTTFTNWQSSFRFDSLHDMAFGQDDDVLEEQMKRGMRKYDVDGTLAMELEATVKGGNPHLEGIVYPRIAEVSLFGGLGCGKQLIRLLIEHLECLKATARQNYDYIVLQATENSIPFYESMGFTRVGCVQGKAPSPNKYCSNPVIEYHTKKNGETPSSIAKEFGVDVWDVVFLNQPMYPELMQKSWLKLGTTIFVPDVKEVKSNVAETKGVPLAPKWHIAEENETPRGIAKKFNVNFAELLQANKKRHPELLGNSKLLKGTRIQISRFDINEGDTVAYSHWTFPDAEEDDHDPSYMMALKLNRRKGLNLKEKPVADSLAVTIQPYSPELFDTKDLFMQPQQHAPVPLAPIFNKKPVTQEPTKPKRPVTSYAHFTTVCRSTMTRELDGLSMVEINKILSDKWRSFTEKDKLPFQLMYEESKAVYEDAMKKYELDMLKFKSGNSNDTSNAPGGKDTSLLEKVVKLKSVEGISGASKFEYFYVLTFIPDLQWVHLIPMRKVGVFGPEYPDSCGRPKWMIVGEEEGKEIDSTASLCKPVTALTMKNSADADKEQWDIYDNGEVPPPQRITPKIAAAAVAPGQFPGAPVRPKRPATSFAFFCADAKNVMKGELAPNMHMSERTKLVAERWKVLPDEQKQKYKDQASMAQEKYAKDIKKYNADLAVFQCENPEFDPSLEVVASKKLKSTKKITPPVVATSTANQLQSSKRPMAPKGERRRQKKAIPVTKENCFVREDTQQAKTNTAPFNSPGENDVILSLNDDRYRCIMWEHFSIMGMNRDAEKEKKASDEAFTQFKQIMGNSGKFFKRTNNGCNCEVDDEVAREKIVADVRRRVTNPKSWNHDRITEKLKSPTLANSYLPRPERAGLQDIVLSLFDGTYKEIMWKHFIELGPWQKGGSGEEAMAETIFQKLKTRLGKCGKFFKKSANGELFEVTNDAAHLKILRDLQRRMKSSRQWLKHDFDLLVKAAEPSLTPTRLANRSSVIAVTKPKLSPSRASQQRLKLSAARPLASIFLRDYSKKRKQTSVDDHHDTSELITRTSRYPERARKVVNDSNIVSDGALSDSGYDEFGPRKKKAKTLKD